MSYLTNPAVLALRRVLRSTGLARPLSLLLGRGGDYEHRFNAKLEASVRPSDCVWDVGANVGYYTTRFAALCGAGGRVYAFEPSPTNSARLRQAVDGLANVSAIETALSDNDGTIFFEQGGDLLGATSRVVPSLGTSKTAASVPVMTGDSLVASGRAQPPNLMKIDVEGHELEVLRGLAVQLDGSDLRDIFIEVHFSQLDAAGRSDVPDTIVKLLERARFSVAWVDPSHLHATRISVGR